MGQKNNIHSFAEYYLTQYTNPKTEEKTVQECFANKCIELGFEMDCGNRFIMTFSNKAFYEPEALKEIIDTVDDVELLGSAVYSHWRYVTHWSNSSLLDDRNRKWFILTFKRLVELTANT